MNKLPLQKRTQIINLLVEGNSLRATSRIADVSINTVTKLLVNVGRACQIFHDKHVVNVASEKIQCDEIWSFVYAKQKNAPQGMENVGDVWTWTGIDPDTKLIISWMVGARDAETANIFIQDIAGRLTKRVQLTTDGFKAYVQAIDDTFGNNIDYAQLVKMYGGAQGESTNERKYSPVECTGAKKVVLTGNPDKKHISTSHVERQNLTMRMHMRRFTRLTNGFSKKMENHSYAIALHFVYYNFCKIHKTLRVTPAVEAGITEKIYEIEDIVKLADTLEYSGLNDF